MVWNWIVDHLPWWFWYAAIGTALLLTINLWLPLARAFWAVLPAPVRWLLAGSAAALAAYLAGRNRGSANERARQRERARHALDTRSRSEAEVGRMTPQQKSKELEQWYRD